MRRRMTEQIATAQAIARIQGLCDPFIIIGLGGVISDFIRSGHLEVYHIRPALRQIEREQTYAASCPIYGCRR